jgi:hypothetical protein
MNNYGYDCSFLGHHPLHKQTAEKIVYIIGLRIIRLARQKV